MPPPAPSTLGLPNHCRKLCALAILLIVCYVIPASGLDLDRVCGFYEDYDSFLRLNDTAECSKASGRQMPNLPMLRSVHCFNNGTGLCKAIAGRFEFYFNTFTDEVLGPVEDSKYVKNGMHFNRVPHAYNVNGKILYADRTINWARNQTKDMERLNLLSINDFNWCQYTVKDNWPYRAAIKDPQTNGRYYIYFFNKQTCLYDTKTKKRLQYNTRFIHKSKARLDQDFNPALFVFEDHISGDFRLVKHKRQHWYEVKYKVLENPVPGLDYFILIEPFESKPCKINGTDSHPILTKDAYRKFSNLCVSDNVHKRPDNSPDNSRLVSDWCGFDEVELADLNVVTNKVEPGRLYESDLHNLPRHPADNERFFGVFFENDNEWMLWAKDNLAFTAVTTIPIPGSRNQVRVIMMWAKYLEKPSDSYDEHYPLPYISDYIATFRFSGGEKLWDVSQRETNAKPFKNLNFVDDIAYLYECKTILVILGPLYTELPPDRFTDLSTKALTGSIYDLGARELVNAFFQHPDEPYSLYMFYRVNYIAKHQYTCGNPDGSSLVKATLVSEYHSRHGNKQFPWFVPQGPRYFFAEEMFFKALDVVPRDQEVIRSPPGDPNDFPYEYELDTVDTSDPNVWLYYLAAIVVLIILLMGLVCLITLRRRRRHQKKLEAAATAQGTLRSSALDQSRDSAASNMPSARSSLPTRDPSTLPSQRSSNISSIRGSTPGRTNRTTASSGLTARSGQSSRLSQASNRTNRSGLKPASSTGKTRDRNKRSTSTSKKRG